MVRAEAGRREAVESSCRQKKDFRGMEAAERLKDD